LHSGAIFIPLKDAKLSGDTMMELTNAVLEHYYDTTQRVAFLEAVE
jgi:hypothetical protein